MLEGRMKYIMGVFYREKDENQEKGMMHCKFNRLLLTLCCLEVSKLDSQFFKRLDKVKRKSKEHSIDLFKGNRE